MTTPGHDSHPVYGPNAKLNPVLRYANDDDKAKLDALIQECLDAETIGQRSARRLAQVGVMENVPFNLDEIQALRRGFVPRTESDGYNNATPEHIALDATVSIKLGVAERRLIDSIVKVEGFNA